MLLLASPRPRGDLLSPALRLLLDAAQACAKIPHAIRHGARAVHDLRRVQDGIGAGEGGERFVIGLPNRGQCLETIPVRVVTSRQGFADPRRPVAQADIAIVPAGIAELGEAAIFAGDQERAGIIHSGIA